MTNAELIPVSEIREGDTVINLGTVEKADHYPEGKTSELVIRHGLCMSAAFYWFRPETKLWVIKKSTTPG